MRGPRAPPTPPRRRSRACPRQKCFRVAARGPEAARTSLCGGRRRHGGGGRAAAGAAAAAGGGGEGREAEPPALRLPLGAGQPVAAGRGAAGPGRAAAGQRRQEQQVGPGRAARRLRAPRCAPPGRAPQLTPPLTPPLAVFKIAQEEEQVRAQEPVPARTEEPEPAPRRREGEAGKWRCRQQRGPGRPAGALAGPRALPGSAATAVPGRLGRARYETPFSPAVISLRRGGHGKGGSRRCKSWCCPPRPSP